VALAGCASFSEPRCSVGEQRLVSDLLYFGTESPVIYGTQWSDFWHCRDPKISRRSVGLAGVRPVALRHRRDHP
jgi:hypothetical protein